MRVLVTGGNAGIGYFAAEQLASAGAEVVIGSRDPAKAEAAKTAIRSRVAGAKVEHVRLDLADLASVGAVDPGDARRRRLQRRGHARPPAAPRDAGRPRADVRHQPPRPLRAGRPAAAAAGARRAHRHYGQLRGEVREARLRRPSERTRLRPEARVRALEAGPDALRARTRPAAARSRLETAQRGRPSRRRARLADAVAAARARPHRGRSGCAASRPGSPCRARTPARGPPSARCSARTSPAVSCGARACSACAAAPASRSAGRT